MIHPRRIRSLVASIAVLGAVGALTAGCSSSIDDAATVGDTHITRADFEAELTALMDNEEFAELLAQEDANRNGATTSTTGSGSGESPATPTTAPAWFAAFWLDTLIDQAVYDDEFETRDLSVTDEHREQAETRMQQFFDANPDDDAPGVFSRFSEDLQRTMIERQARAFALVEDEISDTVADPTEAEALAYYDEQVAAARESCPSDKAVGHILVATEAEAEAVLADLAGGASFPEVAAARSTDTGSAAAGGELGCLAEGQFVPPFEEAALAAPMNEPVGPVETEFGWHVIRVHPLEFPPFEDVREQILATLADQATQDAGQAADAALSAIVTERLQELDVYVDPRYGTFVDDENGPRVEAPTPPDVRDGRATTTTVPSLLEPPGAPAGE